MSTKPKKNNVLLFASLAAVVGLLAGGVAYKNAHQSTTLADSIQGLYLPTTSTVKAYPSSETVLTSKDPIISLLSVGDVGYAATTSTLNVIKNKKTSSIKLPCAGELSQFAATEESIVFVDTCSDNGKQLLTSVFSEDKVKTVELEDTDSIKVNSNGVVVTRNSGTRIAAWMQTPTVKKPFFSKPKTIQQYGSLGGFYSVEGKGLFFWGTTLNLTGYTSYSFEDKKIEPLTPPTAVGFKPEAAFQSLQLSDTSVLWATTVVDSSYKGKYASYDSFQQQLIEDKKPAANVFYNLTKENFQLNGTVISNSSKTVIAVPIKTTNGLEGFVMMDTATGKQLFTGRAAEFAFLN